MTDSKRELTTRELTTAIYQAMNTAMRPEERGNFVSRFTIANPNWRRKPAIEMIERLDRQGAHERIIDEFWKDEADVLVLDFGEAAQTILACAVYWAIYGYGFREPVFGMHVYPLMQRIAHGLRIVAEEKGLVVAGLPGPAIDVTGGDPPEDAEQTDEAESDADYRDALARLMVDHQLVRKLEASVETSFARGVQFGRDVEREPWKRRVRELVEASDRVSSFWSQWTSQKAVDMHGAIAILTEVAQRARKILETSQGEDTAGAKG